jgi:sugar phosphate isomerase/epimerase
MSVVEIAVSNIAWPADMQEEALAFLPSLGISAVEIAPYNVFGRWEGILDGAIRLREHIEGLGLRCVALQGILFNVPEAHLFASNKTRAALRSHLERVAELAGVLGAGACVFGAPRQRDPGDLAPERAWDIACRFLRDVGPAFAAQGSALAFEANASRYACRFVTSTAEAAKLVRDVGTSGIGLQIDTGTVFLEQEDPNVLRDAALVAVHAHLSEPDLRPIGAPARPDQAQLDHTAVAFALRNSAYKGPISVEMRPAEDWRAGLLQATDFIRRVYA